MASDSGVEEGQQLLCIWGEEIIVSKLVTASGVRGGARRRAVERPRRHRYMLGGAASGDPEGYS
jgi:hypothetical protein